MESNWSKRFLYDNGTRRVKPIVFIFAAFQVFLLIIVIASIIQLNSDSVPDDDVERYKRLPELTITGLKDKASILEESEIKDIQKKVFEIVSENTSNIKTSEVKAVIRNDNVHEHNFDGRSKYVNMIIDIPSLEQSYEVFYGSNAVIDPDNSTVVLCLDESKDKPYDGFKCKSSDSGYTRYSILKAYLNLLNFNLFSAYMSPDGSNTVIISPSVTYDNNEATKAAYIKETQDAIDSLGFAASSYNYYVRTAADVNYSN